MPHPEQMITHDPGQRAMEGGANVDANVTGALQSQADG